MSQAGNNSGSGRATRSANGGNGGGSGAAGGGAAGGGISRGAAAAPPPPNEGSADNQVWTEVVTGKKKKAGTAGVAAPAITADTAVSSTSASAPSSLVPADGFATAAGSADDTHDYKEFELILDSEAKLRANMDKEMADLQAL